MGKKIFLPPEIWVSEKGLTALLIFILLFFIGLYPLANLAVGRLLTLIFLSLVLVAGVLAVFDRPVVRLVVGIMAVPQFIFNWLEFFHPSLLLIATESLWASGFMGLLATAILVRVFREGRITYNRICGAVAAYILIGLTYASLCRAMAAIFPGTFQFPPGVNLDDPENIRSALIYFSFVTLTTVGYGDIVPVSSGARLVVMLEALTGQLYPAIMLAWLVSMEIVSRTRK